MIMADNVAMNDKTSAANRNDYDAVIIGGGFAGLYMLHRLRQIGLSARAVESGNGVGGTWYWNRYPGARCDAESLVYSYSFNTEIEQKWEWSERYSTQAEILEYIEHVAKELDLNKHISLNTRVISAMFDENLKQWNIETDNGDKLVGQFCIMATGCLSVPSIPEINGLDSFLGPIYYASQWPHEKIDFNGKKVGIIGTGSSAIQAIPEIAKETEHLTVFQRTANYSVPANNRPLDADVVKGFKAEYPAHRKHERLGTISGFGGLELPLKEALITTQAAEGLSDEAVQSVLEEYWQVGGARFQAAFTDALTNERTNQLFGNFIKDKIRSIVNDRETAEVLCPNSHPFGTKRICVDTNYFETFNRDNVTLVDIKASPISCINETGLETKDRKYHFDELILATGFDAMTGALNKIDIVGRGGQTLFDKWSEGPRSYLGLQVEGFPNLFTITGPGSPSVLSNMLISIEQHVEWVSDLIKSMLDEEYRVVEAEKASEDRWVEHVNEVANATMYPKGGSWYLGANIPGKPRIFMPYAAGVGQYRELCDKVRDNEYEGFTFT